MIIWRFEHPETDWGPYMSREDTPQRIQSMWGEHRADLHGHPMPGRDEGMFQWQADSGAFIDDFRYGCTSLGQLMKWFQGYLVDLFEAGYRVRQYDVPAPWAFATAHQVTYNHLVAKRLY